MRCFDLSKDKFAARLNNGGTVVLDGVDAVWGTPDFQNNTYTFMALDSLQLKNKARIITGGNTLVIFVNRLVSEDGEILAFSGSDRKAANGSGPGASGKPGDGGGLVSIHVVQKVDGILHVDLTGEEGGDGQPGAGGGQGSKGIQGEDADWDAINCKHGGGNGGKGGVGTKGGRGGDGGSGGQGGSLELINVGKTAIPSAAYTFNAPAPKAGIPAPGAPGGPGGPGGGGGNGGGPCGGGSPGPQGDAGPKGDDGNAGSPCARAGSDSLISRWACVGGG